MIWRSPDKPRRIYSLGFITEGEWLAQKKIDGHCAVIIKDGDIEVKSRHNKPLNVSEDLMKELYDIGLEDGQAAVGEWTGLRKSNRIESMQLFSFLYDDFQWLGELGEEQRYEILVNRVKPTDKVNVLAAQFGDYADLYKSTIDDWTTEGVVLKQRGAKLIGSRGESKKNGSMCKLKWRAGPSGEELCIVPDDDLITAA